MNMMIEWLAGNCKKHLLEEKWLLADDLRTAQQWKDQLNLAGHASINLHSKTLRSLAVSLVGEVLAAQNTSFASQATARMLVHSIVSEMLERRELEYFNTVNSIDGLCDLLAKSIRDLRLAEVEPNAMAEKDFESAAKAQDVIRVYQAYCERLQVDHAADYAACIRLATKGIQDGTIKLPNGLMVLVPEELDRLTKTEQGLFEAISKKATIARPNLESFCEEAARRRIADRLSAGATTFEYFSGLGEVNEIRKVVQRILSKERGGPSRFENVEILHTDYKQYVPLFLELLSTWLASNNDDEAKLPTVDSLPLTFAEGIACIYSRPGRALRSWLRWTRADFVQTKAVQLLREGLLVRPAKAEEIGYSRLANTLRRVPIGFKSERYLAKLDEAIQSAKQSQKEYEQLGDKEENQRQADDQEKRDFGLPALEAVFAIMKPLVNLAPNSGNNPVSVLEKARSFLLQCVRAESKLDRYARGKLLDEINGMLATLQSSPDSQFDVLQWLEDLPVQSCIFASGPMPGCIHIAPIAQGGHTGRKELYVVGLDDGRYPRSSPVDPILLDAERGRLSKDLQTAESQSRYQQQILDRVLFRVLEDVDVHVSFSYSVRNFADDRQCFPSAAMLEMFRLSFGQPEAHMDDLLVELGQPISFVSESPDDHLSMAEIGLAGILTEKDETKRRRMLEEQFEHTAQCRIVREFQKAPQVSEYDGLVPRAGEDLDPAAGKPVSPSRLETYGTCPRRFFFQRGLGVYPPDEWTVDSESWLDPLRFGNLVHELFEDFLRGQTAIGLTPSFARDRTPLVALLHSKIELLKLDMPVPNEDAFLRQREQLEDMCEIFLSKEEEYCREHNARPWILESSFGLPGEPKTELDCTEPIALTLSDGRVLRVSGIVDRVDKLMSDGSERYVIWDYKSGSNFGFSHDKPFGQGRKLQPYLYVGMLRHRIAATGGDADAVDSFGYFFPNPKMAGLRLRWTRGELRCGDEVLRHICDSIAAGVFVSTTNESDCTYCHYLSVCGKPEIVARESHWKATQAVNTMLEPLRQLRDIAVEPEATQ